MIVFPWSATGRYIKHLEDECEFYRAQIAPGYKGPGSRKPQKADPPPKDVVELCAKFETHGARVLDELRRERARTGASWDDLADRVRAHIAAGKNGAG
jgi:hypothetical protein